MDIVTPLQIANNTITPKNNKASTVLAMTAQEASFIPTSVREEARELGKLPVAPSSEIVESAVL
jgi:hypothetical protein